MNGRQSLLKISIISFVLLSNTLSFGMIMHYKNKEAVIARCRQCIDRYNKLYYNSPLLPGESSVILGDILDWKKEAEEKKRSKGLSLEEQGKRNLEILYNNQDPEFVSQFLLSHYVPIALIEIPPIHDEKNTMIRYLSVNPYKRTFYADPDMQFIGDEKEIEELGKKRFEETYGTFAEEKKNIALKQNKARLSLVSYYIKNPLINVALFSDDKDIVKELKKIIFFHDNMEPIVATLYWAIIASMSYVYKKKNNALELLLLKLKSLLYQHESVSPGNSVSRIKGSSSYDLLCLAAKNREAFGLLSQIDPYNTNNYLWGTMSNGSNPSEALFSTNLDRMINNKDFDQENIKIYKKNGGMTTEEHGRHNLEILYNNQDPEFVSQFLLSHYVPVVSFAMTPFFIDEGNNIEFFVVNPYKRSFYANPDMQFIGKEKEIEELGKKRLDEAKIICLDKLPKQNPFNVNFKGYVFESSLMTATLFGDDEDIAKELANSPEHLDIYRSVMASIGSPNKKNNALESLLLQLKLLRQQGDISLSDGVMLSYRLLSLAAHNKEAFALISNIDPYKCNMLRWRGAHESEGQGGTNLDRMIKDKNFSLENIRVFRENYGMTTEELREMNSIGDILNKLPQRNIVVTADEEIHMRHFENLSFAKS